MNKFREIIRSRSFITEFIGELWGTYLLVLFGIGSVASAVLSGAQVGLWQVAVVWGFGVTISIYSSSTLSGAHLNPAVTIAIAIFRSNEFPKWKIWYYILAQLLGSILSGISILITWYPTIKMFEDMNTNATKIAPVNAMMFGEYFPNPGIFDWSTSKDIISPFGAACIEGFGTFILVTVIFTLTDTRNKNFSENKAVGALTPFWIGFTVSVLISLYAPLTQAGWNPARDFGPRIVAAFYFGSDAIPGPRFGFWVYIVGPLIGGPLGAGFYELFLAPNINETEDETEMKKISKEGVQQVCLEVQNTTNKKKKRRRRTKRSRESNEEDSVPLNSES